MTAATLPKTRPAPTNVADRPVHLVCDCDEDYALCGEYVGDRPFTEDDVECVVCAGLEGKPCGVEGCPFGASGLRRLYFRLRGWL